MKTLSYLLLIAATSISIVTLADWPLPAEAQPPAPIQQPVQVQQQQAQVAPQPQVQTFAPGYQRFSDAAPFDLNRLNGEYTTPCLRTVPSFWPHPRNYFETQPALFKKVVYSFDGNSLLLRTDVYRDALCGGGRPALQTIQAIPGAWRVRAINTFDERVGEVVFDYDYCFNGGCPPVDLNTVVGNQVVQITFKKNLMFFGTLAPNGQAIFDWESPLFLKGTEPAGNLGGY